MRKQVAVILLLTVFLAGCKENIEKDKKSKGEALSWSEPDYRAFSVPLAASFHHYFESLHNAGRFNGNVLILRDGQLFKESYGYSNYRTKEELSLNHKFQLASASKPFTATAVMQLVQRGKINLSDSIQKFFPNFPYHGVTVRRLLNHRSGLGNYMYITDSLWQNRQIPMCNENALDSFIKEEPAIYYPPNSRFDYCNTNYFLLSAIVEEVSGLSFESYMAKYIFDPLGMKNSLVYSNMDYMEMDSVAVGHNAYGTPKADFYLNGVVGDKGLFTTVEDMFRFERALTNGEILLPAYSDLMEIPNSKLNRKYKSYGLGWRIKYVKNGLKVVYHNGWWRGFRTYFIRVPSKDIVIIALTNSMRGSFLKTNELVGLVLEE